MSLAGAFDHHVHSVVSGDSAVPLEERASTAGSPERPHGISDHYLSTHLHDEDDVLRYIERARALGLRVALEYDLGCAPPLRPSTRDALDYLVGGLHQVSVGGTPVPFDEAGAYLKGRLTGFDRSAFDEALVRGILEASLAVVGEACAETRLDVLAHPTFTPLLALAEPDAAYPLEWQERLIELCLRHGVALEVNESYRVPHPGFLALARDRGARFAVGSDSHGPLLPLTFTEGAVSAAGITDRLRDARARVV